MQIVRQFRQAAGFTLRFPNSLKEKHLGNGKLGTTIDATRMARASIETPAGEPCHVAAFGDGLTGEGARATLYAE